MNTAKVFKMGDPLLLQRAEEVKNYNDPELENTVNLMRNTMTEKPVPITVLINPVMKVLDETEEYGWEGCLSVPGLRGLVPRYTKIEYSGYSFTEKKEITRVAEGFHARVFQHEIDHLDGILFPRKIKDLTRFGYEDSLIF